MAQTKKTNTNENIKVEAPVYDVKGKAAGSMTLPPEIFNVALVPELVSQAVRIYLANQRLGTKSTKTRSEVAGSTRKLFKQKGTGRARHGDIKAPIFIGGGIAHGPKQKDFSLDFPKKMRRKALFSVLTDALKSNKIKFVKGLEELPAKTQELAEAFDNLSLGTKKHINKRTLLVLPAKSENLSRAGRNLDNLTITYANQLHTYEVMMHKAIVIAKDSVDVLVKTFIEEGPKEKVEKDKAEPKKAARVEKREKKETKNPVEKKIKKEKKEVKKEK